MDDFTGSEVLLVTKFVGGECEACEEREACEACEAYEAYETCESYETRECEESAELVDELEERSLYNWIKFVPDFECFEDDDIIELLDELVIASEGKASGERLNRVLEALSHHYEDGLEWKRVAYLMGVKQDGITRACNRRIEDIRDDLVCRRYSRVNAGNFGADAQSPLERKLADLIGRTRSENSKERASVVAELGKVLQNIDESDRKYWTLFGRAIHAFETRQNRDAVYWMGRILITFDDAYTRARTYINLSVWESAWGNNEEEMRLLMQSIRTRPLPQAFANWLTTIERGHDSKELTNEVIQRLEDVFIVVLPILRKTWGPDEIADFATILREDPDLEFTREVLLNRLVNGTKYRTIIALVNHS